MVQSLTKNKRLVGRKAPIQSEPRDIDSDTSSFPEYIESKDGLYRCLLCKSRTLEKYMWLNRSGMYQHQKRGTRHKQSVREWLEAKANGAELSTYEREGDESSAFDSTDVSEVVEEPSEPEDSVEMEEPEPESIVEELPTLYYPTTSWDEPVNQGIRVVFDSSQAIDRETNVLEPLTAPEARKEITKWDGPSQGCVYGSTKTNGYYTCIRCSLPDMPQRKYRRCKWAIKVLQGKSMQAMQDSPELDCTDPPPYQLLYPSN
ncbi:hypothetical protein OPQ81_011659 [Rhizoctonia solani]|nr:hypothetical protein OPQ81_011659 [Rhizoctonia solani]